MPTKNFLVDQKEISIIGTTIARKTAGDKEFSNWSTKVLVMQVVLTFSRFLILFRIITRSIWEKRRWVLNPNDAFFFVGFLFFFYSASFCCSHKINKKWIKVQELFLLCVKHCRSDRQNTLWSGLFSFCAVCGAPERYFFQFDRVFEPERGYSLRIDPRW